MGVKKLTIAIEKMVVGLTHFHEMLGFEIASLRRNDSIYSRFCVSPGFIKNNSRFNSRLSNYIDYLLKFGYSTSEKIRKFTYGTKTLYY
jgi:hypothetical protein